VHKDKSTNIQKDVLNEIIGRFKSNNLWGCLELLNYFWLISGKHVVNFTASNILNS